MITLIGIGNTGTKIVEKLSSYQQYRTIKIDSGEEIKECSSPEEYEEKCPSFKKLFKNLDSDVYVFISSSGKISGSLLRILEQLKEYTLNVVCVCSDPITLSSVGSLQQNVVTGVLQEYARSGLLNSLYLLDNSKIEDVIENIELDKYWEKINETIAYFFHTFMFFMNTKEIFKFGDTDSKVANIHTFGVLDHQKNKTSLYDLKYITNEVYYYSLNKKQNKNTLKEIKVFIQEQSKNKKVGTYIYEVENRDEPVYIRMSTSIPQTAKSDFGSLDRSSDL